MNSQLTSHNSPLGILMIKNNPEPNKESPKNELTTHRSQLTAHRSQLTAHYSPLTAPSPNPLMADCVRDSSGKPGAQRGLAADSPTPNLRGHAQHKIN